MKIWFDNGNKWFTVNFYAAEALWTENAVAKRLTDGTEKLLSDPKRLFPSRLLISIAATEMEAKKNGTDESLLLYQKLHDAHKNKENIVIFEQSKTDYNGKSYKGVIVRLDPALSYFVLGGGLIQSRIPSIRGLGKEWVDLEIWVEKDGTFGDYNNYSSASFEDR